MSSLALSDKIVFVLYFLIVASYGYWVYRKKKDTVSASQDFFLAEVDKYILYRASDNEPYTIITTLEPNKNSFIDNELNIGNTYYYKIKAVFKNGAESIFNNPIKVIY